MKLNRAKQSSVSTTSLCSEKESSYDSNPATMLLPTANTTATFRSFIKTKSQGIMIRKDNGDDDDDEVEQLCDSESSKLDSNECTSGPVTVPSTPNTPDCPASTSAAVITGTTGGFQENLVIPTGGGSSSVSLSGSERTTTGTSTINDDDPKIIMQQSRSKNHDSNGSKLFTEMGSGSYLYEADTNNSSSTGAVGGQKNCSSSGKRNYHRGNHIIPILKPNRFVKHAKQNILLHNTNGGKNQKNSNGGHHHHHHHQLKKRSNSESVPSLYTSQEICKSLRSDRMVITQPDEDRRRRTIIIEKQKNSFGFTLQTYGIKNGSDIELITYVDDVTYGGPAFRGGMRPGDVILSINGRDVEKADHPTLVGIINSCEKTMRLVVLFEDCIRKIELHLRFIKLQKHLQQKLTQLEILNQREDQILLNAALRTCAFTTTNVSTKKKPPSHDENCNHFSNVVDHIENDQEQEEDLKQSSIGGGCGGVKKKYKCKSLDVSLNDLNDRSMMINRNETGYEDLELIMSNNNDENKLEYSTTTSASTFPRHTMVKSSTNVKNDDENEILINNTIDDGGRMDLTGGSGGKSRQTNDQQQSSVNFRQSKSLPHSVSNSLDCLTNEAYEDDEEDLNEQHYQPQQHRKNFSVTSSVSSEKDFITKL